MSAATVASLIARSRIILSDDKPPPRWEDSVLLTYFNEGRAQLWQYRPAAFYRDRIVTTPPEDLALGGVCDVTVQYQRYLVNYMAARALGQDAEHAANMAMADYIGGRQPT